MGDSEALRQLRLELGVGAGAVADVREQHAPARSLGAAVTISDIGMCPRTGRVRVDPSSMARSAPRASLEPGGSARSGM